MTERSPETLVLWDVDQTLVDVGSLSRGAFEVAFLEVTGRPLLQLAELAGRTDRAIITETLALHGISASESILSAFGDALSEAFSEREDRVRECGRVLPGAEAALTRLVGRTDVVQSVLTGNMRSIAVGKLTALDLAGFVDLDVGAFGLDDSDRPGLVRLARTRANEKYRSRLDEKSTVLIGDTPHDVTAGREGGARVVAIASGGSDVETLAKAGADAVLPDLTDTDAVIRAVLARSRQPPASRGTA